MLLRIGVFLDACLSATLSSVLLNGGGAAPFIGSIAKNQLWAAADI